MRRLLIMSLALLALVAAACGGGSSSSGDDTPSCTSANATDLTGSDSFTITIKNYTYQPACFSAKNGSTITIKNEDTATHTFTVIGTGVDVAVDPASSKTQPRANLAPATYQFHCTLHPEMTGTVIVVAS